MTQKLREKINERDDYTCCICENSTYEEPNLLLEIDHMVPIAKGGKLRKIIYKHYVRSAIEVKVTN